MQPLIISQRYALLPPVPEAQMFTHGFAYQQGTFVCDVGLEDLDHVLA